MLSSNDTSKSMEGIIYIMAPVDDRGMLSIVNEQMMDITWRSKFLGSAGFTVLGDIWPGQAPEPLQAWMARPAADAQIYVWGCILKSVDR